MARPATYKFMRRPSYVPKVQQSAPLVEAAPPLLKVARMVEGWVAMGNPCPVCLHLKHAIDCELIDAIAKAEGR
jgi:hypothetical protein